MSSDSVVPVEQTDHNITLEQLADWLLRLDGEIVQPINEHLPEVEALHEAQQRNLETLSEVVEKQACLQSVRDSDLTARAARFRPVSRTAFLYQQAADLLRQAVKIVEHPDERSDESLSKLKDAFEVLGEQCRQDGADLSRIAVSRELDKGLRVLELGTSYREDYLQYADMHAQLRAILVRHATELRALRAWYSKSEAEQEEASRPDVTALLKSLGEYKKKFPKDEHHYLERLTQTLPPDLAEQVREELSRTLKELGVGFSEYTLDQFKRLAGLPDAVNPLRSDSLRAVQKQIEKAQNMAEVVGALHKLRTGMEKLYGFHWVYETFFKYYYQQHAEAFSQFFPKQKEGVPPTIGVMLGTLKMRCKEWSVPFSGKLNLVRRNADKWLSRGVRFRNQAAHEGILYAPERFAEAIKAYRTYGNAFVRHLELPLEKVPKRLLPPYSEKQSRHVIARYLKLLTEPVADKKRVNNANGFAQFPQTHLTLEDLLARARQWEGEEGVHRLLHHPDVRALYHKPDSGLKVAKLNFIQELLARHFSGLLVGKPLPYDVLRAAYQRGYAQWEQRVENKSGKKAQLPGFQRALFMWGKAQSADSEILHYKTWGGSPFMKGEHILSVKQVAELIWEGLEHKRDKDS